MLGLGKSCSVLSYLPERSGYNGRQEEETESSNLSSTVQYT